MPTDIKQALKILAPNTSAFKKSEIDELVTSLQGITVNELTNDKDKEMFMEVAVLSKKLTTKLKDQIEKIDAKHKPDITKLTDDLKAAKEAYSEAVDPFKNASRELKRIDEEARNAVSRYATKQMQEAQKATAPAPGEKKYMTKGADASDLGLKKGGHEMTFANQKKVEVVDINKVPPQFVIFHADEVAARLALKKLGINDDMDVKVQSDGTLAIKVKPADLPASLLKRVGVKERVILDLGGCEGVKITEEARAVVK